MAERTHHRRNSSRRSTIIVNPSVLPPERQPPSLPLPPFRPRQRRPHSIRITRLPQDYVWYDPPASKPKEPSRLRIHFEKLASSEHAKRVIGSFLSPFTLKPSNSSSSSAANSIRSSSPVSTPSRSNSVQGGEQARGRPTIAERRASSRMPSRPPLATRGNRNSIVSLNVEQPEPRSSDYMREDEKPVASGNGVSCSILLKEPHVFLTGFDHDGRGHNTQNSCALLRGKLRLNVTKSAKIKAVTLKFTGKAKTDWPEGLPPEKTKYTDTKDIRTTVMPFFNAMYPDAEYGYGAQCVYTPKDNKSASSSTISIHNFGTDSENDSNSRSHTPTGLLNPIAAIGGRHRSSSTADSKAARMLAVGAVQSRSFQKGDSSYGGTTPNQKGYKVFHPGVYEYGFEITIDHVNPETIHVPLGGVKWELEAFVERAGAFRANLLGTREVKIIRAPDQNSLEQVEPIAISRKWEDQLHYDIVISGKSFPLGAKIPIAFKLTPLAKVQCHRIKVYVTENIEYFTHDNRITRKDGTRKMLLFEKHAGRPIAKQYQKSDMRILSGGELGDEARAEARRSAERQREWEARRSGGQAAPLPAPTDNLLGDIDLGLESLITATEIEMNVQLPTCAEMKKDKLLKIHPDTTYRQIQVHHWIKIVMRLSRLDTDDPSGTKRRHFEISIDSPFHILSCLADTSNTSLPQYTEHVPHGPAADRECGCPDAPTSIPSSRNHSSGEIPTLSSMVNPIDTSITGLARPPQAHLQHHVGHNGSGQGVQSSQNIHQAQTQPTERNVPFRPMHIIRAPSFNPPSFDFEEPPPPLATPPPEYDMVAGTPSQDGLGDYFRRLADAYEEEGEGTDDEGMERAVTRGRVNIPNPRMPGGRIARSMDVPRPSEFAMFEAGLARSGVGRVV